MVSLVLLLVLSLSCHLSCLLSCHCCPLQLTKRNEKGETLLHLAAIQGNARIAEQLILEVGGVAEEGVGLRCDTRVPLSTGSMCK